MPIFLALHTSHYALSVTLPATRSEFLLLFPPSRNAKLNADEYNHHQAKYAINYFESFADISPKKQREHQQDSHPALVNHPDALVLAEQLTNYMLNRETSHANDRFVYRQPKTPQVTIGLYSADILKSQQHHAHRPYPKV